MPKRTPASQSYFQPASEPQSIHDTYRDRVIAGGGVETVWFLASSIASTAFLATRKNDIAWAVGTLIVTFFAAGGAREDATIRDASLGALTAGAGVLVFRALKPQAFQGQQ